MPSRLYSTTSSVGRAGADRLTWPGSTLQPGGNVVAASLDTGVTVRALAQGGFEHPGRIALSRRGVEPWIYAQLDLA